MEQKETLVMSTSVSEATGKPDSSIASLDLYINSLKSKNSMTLGFINSVAKKSQIKKIEVPVINFDKYLENILKNDDLKTLNDAFEKFKDKLNNTSNGEMSNSQKKQISSALLAYTKNSLIYNSTFEINI